VTDLRDRFVSGARNPEGDRHMAGKDSGGQDRAAKQTEEVEEVVEEAASDVQDRVKELTDNVDDLLDEIDDVLEQNAEEFVKSYVQKGGE
jgi:ubiquitin-like protein Pup